MRRMAAARSFPPWPSASGPRPYKRNMKTPCPARADVIRALLDINAAKELIGTSRMGVDAARVSFSTSGAKIRA